MKDPANGRVAPAGGSPRRKRRPSRRSGIGHKNAGAPAPSATCSRTELRKRPAAFHQQRLAPCLEAGVTNLLVQAERRDLSSVDGSRIASTF